MFSASAIHTHLVRICDSCRKPPAKNKPLNPALTFRETQLIALVSQGKSNKEIGYELCLATGTIKLYLSRVFLKLKVNNRTHLAMWHVAQNKPPIAEQ